MRLKLRRLKRSVFDRSSAICDASAGLACGNRVGGGGDCFAGLGTAIDAVGDRSTGIFVNARGLLGVFSRRWFGHCDGDDFQRIASLSCL